MENAKHTPGPWVIENFDKRCGWADLSAEKRGTDLPSVGCAIAKIYTAGPGTSGHANAALIAAAPETAAERDRLREINAELLAACEAILEIADSRPFCPIGHAIGHETQLRAAIANAKGGAE